VIRKIIDAVTALIPFLAPYPSWVKVVLVAWLIFTACVVAILLLAHPRTDIQTAKTLTQTPTPSSPASPQEIASADPRPRTPRKIRSAQDASVKDSPNANIYQAGRDIVIGSVTTAVGNTPPSPSSATGHPAAKEHQKRASPSHAVKWAVENTSSKHPREAPYAIKVTLSTDHTISTPHVDILCDSTVENGTVSAGVNDPTAGGEAVMITGAQNEANTYHFVMVQPVFTANIQVWVSLESKQPLQVLDVRVEEPDPRSLAQTVVNSPGATAILAGGNVEYTQIDPHEFVVMDSKTADTLSAALTRLKRDFPLYRVRIEQENGSGARRRVAAKLGEFVHRASLGTFYDGTNVGVYPDSPITVAYRAVDEKFAHTFAEAIGGYIRGATAFMIDERWQEHEIRFYLSGEPSFHTDGTVVIK
jgi:hypothetical protein